jgi:hypothetical protein
LKQSIWAGCALAALLAISSPGHAEEAPKCHVSATHVVVERESKQDFGGMSFLVKPKAAPDAQVPCVYEASNGSFEIDVSEDAYYFLGLQGRFLVLDAGTGPVRSLVVHDLDKRRKIFDATTSGEGTKVTDQGVTFWMQTAQGTAKNCKQFKEYAEQALGAAIETLATFNFASLKSRKSDQTRCVATQ